MQKAAFVVFVCTFLVVSISGWYQDRTDLPDGDAEISCSTSAGLDIGQDLSEQLKFDYVKMPKAQWFRLRGQILRVSYDSAESILRHDDLQRQGNCYFQAISGVETEYIQSVPFPRASSWDSAYNYYFSARMAHFNGQIQIQLEWYDENNVLMNSTAIQSVPLSLEDSCESICIIYSKHEFLHRSTFYFV